MFDRNRGLAAFVTNTSAFLSGRRTQAYFEASSGGPPHVLRARPLRRGR